MVKWRRLRMGLGSGDQRCMRPIYPSQLYTRVRLVRVRIHWDWGSGDYTGIGSGEG